MQLIDLFASSLLGQRGEVGLELAQGGPESALTFGELDERSNRLARLLARRGAAAGDRLAVYLPNGLGFVDLVLACLKLGVILVPVNILYREREIRHILADAEPRALVTTAGLADDVFGQDVRLKRHAAGTAAEPANTADAFGTPLWRIDELTADAQTEPADTVRIPLDGSAPAALVYTSGTTGRAKGAVLSHDNFLANTANLVACWRITAADRYLAVLPLFHVHGLANGLMTWLASGCRMCLAERFDIARAEELFARFQPTLFFGVPTVYVRLLELPAASARAIGARMRLFVSGSAPLPQPVFHGFRERFGHAILERYGMSETLMNISNPYAGERRAGSVGFPLPGVSTRIVTPEGDDAAAGVAGELHLRGPNVFPGYWRNPEATAAAFSDAWFRTGDVAERSADGYFTLRGRSTELIISAGFNIYPREIEDVLSQVPGVREAVVTGAPDPRRGEVPVAYLVADTGVRDDVLEAACRRSLASFKVPRAFVRVDTLPRTALGKIQKHLLPPWAPGTADR
jgi:malonyl-CoA/methylmalonyl-CoA synthetase